MALALLVSLLAAVASSRSSAESVEGLGGVAIRLRTEYLENPLGIDVAAPRFSWALSVSRRSVAVDNKSFTI